MICRVFKPEPSRRLVIIGQTPSPAGRVVSTSNVVRVCSNRLRVKATTATLLAIATSSAAKLDSVQHEIARAIIQRLIR